MIKRAISKMDNPPQNCTEPSFVTVSGTTAEKSVGFPLKGLRCGESFELVYSNHSHRPLPQLEDMRCGIVTHIFSEAMGYGPWLHVFQGVATVDMPWFVDDSTEKRVRTNSTFCSCCNYMNPEPGESIWCHFCTLKRMAETELIVV